MTTTLSYGLADPGRTGLPRLPSFYLPFLRYKGERKSENPFVLSLLKHETYVEMVYEIASSYR